MATAPLNLLPHKDQSLPIEDGELLYWPGFVAPSDADRLFEALKQTLAWRQDQIKLFGRQCWIPRLQAWYADPGIRYRYSGLELAHHAWTDELQQLRQRVEQQCCHRFNAVLANLYRDGLDSMGWHSDDEPELGTHPVIASLSLGQPRPFKLRRRNQPDQQYEIELEHGSLLLMGGALQHHWQHALPKRLRLKQPRINLTFRRVARTATIA